MEEEAFSPATSAETLRIPVRMKPVLRCAGSSQLRQGRGFFSMAAVIQLPKATTKQPNVNWCINEPVDWC